MSSDEPKDNPTDDEHLYRWTQKMALFVQEQLKAIGGRAEGVLLMVVSNEGEDPEKKIIGVSVASVALSSEDVSVLGRMLQEVSEETNVNIGEVKVVEDDLGNAEDAFKGIDKSKAH